MRGDDRESAFVGRIVADEDRRPAAERRPRQKRRDRAAFVVAGRLELDRAVRLHDLDRNRRKSSTSRVTAWRRGRSASGTQAIMNDKTEALVFDERARECCDLAGQAPSTRGEGNAIAAGVGAGRFSRLKADLGAVNSARAQAQRLEQAIEVPDRPAADERQRAGELAFGLWPSVATRPAGVTTSSGRSAKSSSVPSTSRKTASGKSPKAATSSVVAPTRDGALIWHTRNS